MPAGDPLPEIARIQPGLYRHWKGALYSVVSCGRASWAPGLTIVSYLDAHGELWHRPLAEWQEPVRWPDGVMRPRFVRVVPPPLRPAGPGRFTLGAPR